MYKIYFSLLVFLLVELFFTCNTAFANNAFYVTLSNQMARKRQLEVVSNNAANVSSVGYEQEEVIFRKVDTKQNSKRKNSFVWAETTYKNGEKGSLKTTNRPTDLAIGGDGYFKLITPRGARYTLDGSMFINSQNILVNTMGYPYANREGEPIEIPDNFQSIDISEDGTVFIDDEEISRIGVFVFANNNDPLIKEGNSMYKSSSEAIAIEDYTIISGALRESNVNPTLVMAKMVEAQRSVGITNNLMSELSDLDRSVINKLSK